jgi:hypothetical protein
MNPVEEFARRYFRDDQVVWRTDQHKAFDGPPCPKDPRHKLLVVQFGQELRVSCNGKCPPAEIEAALANTVARHEPSKLAYALAYARQGFRVFPLHHIEEDRECSCGKLQCSSAGKHPIFSGWQTEATTDETQIRAWWKEHPQANVGVRCGETLTVLDVDGDLGRETIRELELANGELPETPIALTGSGGQHYYFKFEPGLSNAVRFAPGLDIRTEGGLIVGVGSKTKNPYLWEASATLSANFRPAQMPLWLIEKIKAASAPSANGARIAVPSDVAGMGEGSGRNSLVYKLGRSLKAQGFPPEAIKSALAALDSQFKVPLGRELAVVTQSVLTEADRPGFGTPALTQNGAAVSKTELRVLNISDFLQLQIAQREFVLSPIIHERDSVMIHASRGLGKTHLGLSMAYGMAIGGKVLRWEAPRPRRVLYIDGEMPASTMQERLSHIIAAYDQEPPTHDYLRIITPDCQEFSIPNLSTPEGQDQIDELLDKTEVIFFDSISTLFHGGRENEAESWLPAQQWALRLRRRGICSIFQHHDGKGGTQRGTSRREDTLDAVIHLVRPADYSADQGARFEIHFEKARALFGDSVRPFEAKLEVQDGRTEWIMRDCESAKLAQAAAMFRDKMTVRDVAEELNISRSQAHRIRQKLQEEAIGNA